jgi:hypothetical protein
MCLSRRRSFGRVVRRESPSVADAVPTRRMRSTPSDTVAGTITRLGQTMISLKRGEFRWTDSAYRRNVSDLDIKKTRPVGTSRCKRPLSVSVLDWRWPGQRP